MGAILDRSNIKKLVSADVTRNTKAYQNGKVISSELGCLMRGYFLSIFDIRRSSFSDIYFGGDIFMKRRRNTRYYNNVTISPEDKFYDKKEKSLHGKVLCSDVTKKIELLRKASIKISGNYKCRFH